MHTVIYDVATGKILRVYDGPADYAVMQAGAGEAIVFSYPISDADHYVTQGEVTPRPAQSTIADKAAIQANGVDAITITGAPNGATFAARNLTTGEKLSGPISSGDTFSSAVAGKFVLTVTQWPYLDWTATVEAV